MSLEINDYETSLTSGQAAEYVLFAQPVSTPLGQAQRRGKWGAAHASPQRAMRVTISRRPIRPVQVFIFHCPCVDISLW